MQIPSQHLEKSGDLKEALKHYELSGCAHIEVPRMFFETQQIGELEKYVSSKVRLGQLPLASFFNIFRHTTIIRSTKNMLPNVGRES